MFHWINSLGQLVVAVATMAAVNIAVADPTVPHKETAVGQLTNIENPTPDNPAGRMDFIGVGYATHMGTYTQVGGHDFFPDGTRIGEFESTAADGSVVAGIYYGTFEDIGGGFVRFDVTAEWLLGTDRLEGVTGIGEVIAILDLATGIFEYDTDATWTMP